MKANYVYCNNCGKTGHIFQNCKKPIISSGIIAFRKIDNQIQYLMICRKDTLGYVDFMRGKYPLYNKIFLKNFIDEMTVNEKKKIKEKEFTDLWNELWGPFVGLQYRTEETYSQQRFLEVKRGVDNKNTCFDLNGVIQNSKTNWVNQEWGFPKGRRNPNENDMKCAIREFSEETGIKKENINVIQNIMPFEEIFIGSNFKSYKHKYYLAYIENNNISINNYQKSEVSNIKWVNVDEALSLIREYNLEKKNIIIRVQKLLEKYSLIL